MHLLSTLETVHNNWYRLVLSVRPSVHFQILLKGAMGLTLLLFLMTSLLSRNTNTMAVPSQDALSNHQDKSSSQQLLNNAGIPLVRSRKKGTRAQTVKKIKNSNKCAFLKVRKKRFLDNLNLASLFQVDAFLFKQNWEEWKTKLV